MKKLSRSNRRLSGFSSARLALALGAVLLAACSSTPIPNRDPAGEPFPAVGGEALDGKQWRLPADLAGKPAILLVGFIQDAQFDIDRWLLGITQVGTPVPFLELPTIKGLAPRMFKGTIDEGMRKGIPIEDWRGVVTLWADDAASIVELTGNERPRNARVILIDANGDIAWFTDRGFSPAQMVDLDAVARELLDAAGPESDPVAPAS